jgi:transcription initiation factor IIF auxiliary subunit
MKKDLLTSELLTDVYSDLLKYRSKLKLELQEIKNSDTPFLDYLCQEKIDKVESNLEKIKEIINH